MTKASLILALCGVTLAACVAVASSAAASSWRSTPGSVRPALGAASNAPASVSARPLCWTQPVKLRAAAARRAMLDLA